MPSGMITGLTMGAILVLAFAGVPLARKFVRGYFRGVDIYVVLEIGGQTKVYKNPNHPFRAIDEPLLMVPHEIFYSDKFETYYNVCWFDDLGGLHRCGHAYHRKPENAEYCDYRGIEGALIGRILEEK